jgi:hypothetical protein
VIGKSGVSGSPIILERVRATDVAATGAPGWTSTYDGQVVQTVTAGNSGISFSGLGSYFTIDGRIPAGWKINYSDNSDGVEIGGSAPANVTLRYIQAWGPGVINETGDVRGFDLTPTTGSLDHLVMQYCEAGNGGDSCVYLNMANNALIEHCLFHDADAKNEATFHSDVIYCGKVTNSTFRYNQLYNISVEGLFFGDPGNQNIAIYDNLFYQGTLAPNSGRGIQFDSASSGNSGVLVYNNVFDSLPNGAALFDSGSFSGSIVENNIFWNTDPKYPVSGVTHDYNFYKSSGWSEAHGIENGILPFLSAVTFDYHLTGTAGPASPIGKGANLGPPYNIDLDGNTRAASGPWDMGAYAANSNSSPTPTPGSTPSPTASPRLEPTPPPMPLPPGIPTPAALSPSASPMVSASPSPTSTPELTPTPTPKHRSFDDFISFWEALMQWLSSH